VWCSRRVQGAGRCTPQGSHPPLGRPRGVNRTRRLALLRMPPLRSQRRHGEKRQVADPGLPSCAHQKSVFKISQPTTGNFPNTWSSPCCLLYPCSLFDPSIARLRLHPVGTATTHVYRVGDRSLLALDRPEGVGHAPREECAARRALGPELLRLERVRPGKRCRTATPA
jgi:hypothetical protein